ncbi:MAG: ATPase [Hyphomicrobiales bacterium]|nr:ATPase [Hyphomicrobiales bacterium]
MYHPRRIEMEPPRRVMVIGSPGSDKASLCRELSTRLNLPLIALDREYWQPGWKRPDPAAWRARVAELAGQDEWVIQGTYPSTLDIRALRADWIVWIDLPMPVCFTRKLRQMLSARKQKTSEIATGCPRRFDASLLRFIWSFPTVVAPRIAALIARERRNRTIFILRTKHEREEFLARVPTLGGMGRDVADGKPES